MLEPLLPPLKWAGGKRWQLSHVRPLWEPFADRRLVEPFCGGLAISLGLRPEVALLNDINPHLINFYRWLKRGLRIELDLENTEEAFYACRARFNATTREGHVGTREAASLFYYLNKTAYNGLCRFNSRGEFNVPFGRYARVGYKRDFEAYREAFAAWRFRSGDFQRIRLAPNDFIYADPPYDVPFTRYAKEDFTWHDQVRTARWLARHPGPVVLVNQETRRIRELYDGLGYHIRRLSAPRRISCTGDRTPAAEILATRNIDPGAA